MSDRGAERMTAEFVMPTEPVQRFLRLGPIDVRTDAADVEMFAQALGYPDTFGPVPLTFPIRWLSLPDIRGKALRWLETEEAKIVHWSQSFDFVRPLELDRNYSVEAVVHRNSSLTDETILRGTVRDSAGNPIVTLNTILRTLTMRPGRETVRRLQDVARKPLFKLDIEPVDLAQTRRYSTASLDYNPLHTDVNAARAIGLPDIIVHGMMVMGQFERAVAGWRRHLRITRLNAMFLRPLPVGRPIVVSGRMVKSVRNGNDEQSIVRIIVGTDLDDVVYVGEATVSASIDGTNGSPFS